MPGPPPKDPSVRSRRNKTTTRATLTSNGAKAKAPALPAGVEWNAHTRAWWRDIWASPMASEWADSERHELFMLAVLVNAFWETPTKELAGEIRLQRQCFGLTAMDRRRLQWEIEKVEGAKKQPPPKKPNKAPTKKADPRRHLSAVS